MVTVWQELRTSNCADWVLWWFGRVRVREEARREVLGGLLLLLLVLKLSIYTTSSVCLSMDK